MRLSSFALRCSREILRDWLNIIFGLGFPVILLLLLSAIQANIPVELFVIDHLSPGIAVFGLSFVSLFSGMLIAKDRSSSFMLRLFASPLTSADFILATAASAADGRFTDCRDLSCGGFPGLTISVPHSCHDCVLLPLRCVHRTRTALRQRLQR
jgi:hypothetical protein